MNKQGVDIGLPMRVMLLRLTVAIYVVFLSDLLIAISLDQF